MKFKKFSLLTFTLVSSLILGVNNVNALEDISSKEDLESCLSSAEEVVCTLGDNITSDGMTLNLQKGESTTLDLNGYTLTLNGSIKLSDGYDLTVKGGNVYSSSTSYLFVNTINSNLNLTSGTYTNEKSAGGIVKLIGNNDASTVTKLNVQEDVTFKGNYGIVIIGDDTKIDGVKSALGVLVDFAGSIENINHNNGYDYGTIGITINGKYKYASENAPIINLRNTAVINSVIGNTGNKNDDDATAIYGAGYGTWNIYGGTYTGSSAISIKSGNYNIYGGTFNAVGEYYEPATANNAGTESTGAAVSVTANNSYGKNISLNITNGKFISENGYALYEAKTNSDTTAINSISVSGGSFEANTANVSTALKITSEAAELENFVTGGTFNTQLNSKYINPNYTFGVTSSINYNNLNISLAVAKSEVEKDTVYTSTSRNNLSAKIEDIETNILNNNSLDQDAVDAATLELNGLIDALEKLANYTILNQTIVLAENEAAKNNTYTSTSINNLSDAIESAKNINSDLSILNQDEIDTENNLLNIAINSLDRYANYNLLNNTIAVATRESGKTDIYTTASRNNLISLIETIKETTKLNSDELLGEKAGQEIVDEAAAMLNNAIDLGSDSSILVEKAYYGFLINAKNAKESAKTLEDEKYTKPSLEVYNAALLEANNELDLIGLDLEKTDENQSNINRVTSLFENVPELVLAADYSSLSDALAEREAQLLSGNYTTSSVKRLKKAIKKGKAIVEAREIALENQESVALLVEKLNNIELLERADFSQLVSALENVVQKEAGKAYTSASENTYDTTIAAANELVSLKDNADIAAIDKQQEIDDMVVAINALTLLEKADFTNLEAAIEAAKAKDLSLYTEESKTAFNGLVSYAESLASDQDVAAVEKQTLIDSVTSELNNYVLTYLPADYSAYSDILESVTEATNNSSLYTTSSYAEFLSIMNTFEELEENLTIDRQNEIDEATEVLTNAYSKLEVKADFTALEEAIEAAKAKDLSLYTDESKTAFNELITTAEELASNKDVAASEKQTLIDETVESLNNFEFEYLLADYSEYNEALSKVNAAKNNEETYFAESYAEFIEALTDLEELEDNLTIDKQELVDNATNILNNALSLLEEKADYTLVEEARTTALDKLNVPVNTYTAASLEEFNNIFDAAETTYELFSNLPKSRENELNIVIGLYQEAQNKLVYKADYTELINLYEEVNSRKVDGVSYANETEFTEKLNIANTAFEELDKDLADTEENRSLISEVVEAFNAVPQLIEAAVYTELENAILSAESTYDSNKVYTKPSLTEYLNAYEAAKAILEVADSSNTKEEYQEAIDNAVNALNEAVENLKEAADYSDLVDAIDNATLELNGNYTTKTLDKLKTAIKKAKKIVKAREIALEDQDSITTLVGKLNAYVSKLQVKADFTNLEAAIEAAKAKNLSLYTEETKEAFNELITNAENLASNQDVAASTYQDLIDETTESLNNFEFKYILANYSEYNETLEKIELAKADEDTYTKSSFTKFIEALSSISELDLNLGINEQDIVDTATEKLEGALSLLELKADYTLVEEARANAVNAVNNVAYTNKSISEYEQALIIADTIYESVKDLPKSRENELNLIINLYNEAAEKLVEKANYEAVESIRENLIAEEELQETYTTDSINEYKEMLEIAENLYNENNDLSVEESEKLEEIVNAYLDAIEKLVTKANYTLLEEAVINAENKYAETTYTNSSSEAYIEALNNAKELLENKSDNNSYDEYQEIVDNATSSLNEAVDALVEAADYTNLNSAKQAAEEALEANVYTKASINEYTAVINAIEAALKGLNDLPKTRENELNILIDSYNNAVSKLKVKADYSEIDNIRENLYQEDYLSENYTADSIDKYKEALEIADNYYSENNDLSVEESEKLEEIASKYSSAISKLVKKADYCALEEALANATIAYDEEKDYTEESKENYLEAYNSAAEIMSAKTENNSKEEYQETIDNAVSTLNEAVSKLELKEQPAIEYADYTEYNQVSIQVEQAQNNQELYTEESYANFIAALEEITSVEDNLTAEEQNIVDEATTALTNALNLLVLKEEPTIEYADFTSLEEAINNAPVKEEGVTYTESSLSNYESVMNEASDLLSKKEDGLTKEEIQSQIDTIIEKVNSLTLEEKADYSYVNSARESALDIIDADAYTNDSTQAYYDIIREAETLFNDKSDLSKENEEELTEIINLYNNAKNVLVKVGKKTITINDETGEAEEDDIIYKASEASNSVIYNSVNSELNDKVYDARENGSDVLYSVNANKINPADLDSNTIEAINSLIEGANVLEYYDINIVVTSENNVLGNVTETILPITFNIMLSDTDIKNNRDFYIVRVHEGTAEIINSELNENTITFRSDKFSTYALLYKDTMNNQSQTPITEEEIYISPNTGDNTFIYFLLNLFSIVSLISMYFVKQSQKNY